MPRITVEVSDTALKSLRFIASTGYLGNPGKYGFVSAESVAASIIELTSPREFVVAEHFQCLENKIPKPYQTL